MSSRPALRLVHVSTVARPDAPLPLPRARTPRRRPIVIGIVLSLAVHAALLYGLRAPQSPPPLVPAPLEVVLVEPLVPVAAAPAAPAPPQVKQHAAAPKPPRASPRREAETRAQARPETRQRAERPQGEPAASPRREAAPEPPAPLAVPRPEAAQAAATPPVPAAPSAGESTSAPAASSSEPARGAGRLPDAASPSFDAAYLRNPAPPYPLIARRNGQQGTVTLRVMVTRDGAAGSVTVESSSGFPALDAAALGAVKAWRFVPARRNGQAIDAPVLVPVVFRLREAS